jgi:hypothetical protein
MAEGEGSGDISQVVGRHIEATGSTTGKNILIEGTQHKRKQGK